MAAKSGIVVIIHSERLIKSGIDRYSSDRAAWPPPPPLHLYVESYSTIPRSSSAGGETGKSTGKAAANCLGHVDFLQLPFEIHMTLVLTGNRLG